MPDFNNWGVSYSIISFFERALTGRKPLTDEQRQELMSKAWNEWLSRKDDGRLFAWSFSFEVEAAHGIKE